MINTLVILLLFQTIGEAIAHGLSLPVPGPVIGMLLLFCFLMLKKEVIGVMAPTVHGLLKHLSILFVPAGVGVMVHGQRIAAEWLPITVALVFSTVFAIIVTALTIRWLQK